ncbi:MAG: hypothetical protein R3F37_18845 [Candidatus Competibacteraceae bacterium]
MFTDSHHKQQKFGCSSHHDPLTELPNRLFLQERFSEALHVAAIVMNKSSVYC